MWKSKESMHRYKGQAQGEMSSKRWETPPAPRQRIGEERAHAGLRRGAASRSHRTFILTFWLRGADWGQYRQLGGRPPSMEKPQRLSSGCERDGGGGLARRRKQNPWDRREGRRRGRGREGARLADLDCPVDGTDS